MVDVCLLTIGSVPAAFAYNYHAGGIVTGLRMGYDASVSRDGLGTALLYRMLEDSCQRGDQGFDLGIGSQQFKHGFRTRALQNVALRHCALSSWRGQTLRLGQWLKRHVESTKSLPGDSQSKAQHPRLA